MEWLPVAEQLAVDVPLVDIPQRYQRALKNKPSALQNGHRICDDIRKRLGFFDTKKQSRSYDQARMQDLFLSACAHNIYGAAFATNQVEIMRYNNWAAITPYAGVQTPRRFGKSFAVGGLLSTQAVCVPDIVISIFSPGARASGDSSGLLSIIEGFLTKVHGVTKFVKRNKENLYFRHNGSLRKINAYPGGINS